MVSKELKNIIDQLKKQGEMCFMPPAKRSQIFDFEKQYKCKLPKQYKEWLSHSDGGECFLPAGVQFYGVAHKPLIDVNDNDRPSDDFVIIGALATGDPILYRKGNEQISIYNHGAGKIEKDEIYKDFFAFLNDLYDLLGLGE